MDEEKEFEPIEIIDGPLEGFPSEQKPPITFEDLGGDVYLVEGTKFSGDFFRAFRIPSEDERYLLEKKGDVCTMHRLSLKDFHDAVERFEGKPKVVFTGPPVPIDRNSALGQQLERQKKEGHTCPNCGRGYIRWSELKVGITKVRCAYCNHVCDVQKEPEANEGSGSPPEAGA